MSVRRGVLETIDTVHSLLGRACQNGKDEGLPGHSSCLWLFPPAAVARTIPSSQVFFVRFVERAESKEMGRMLERGRFSETGIEWLALGMNVVGFWADALPRNGDA
jgi:hypothetical protein